jgi:hypothetical protein
MTLDLFSQDCGQPSRWIAVVERAFIARDQDDSILVGIE